MQVHCALKRNKHTKDEERWLGPLGALRFSLRETGATEGVSRRGCGQLLFLPAPPPPFCPCHIPYCPFPVIVNLFVWLCVQLLSLPVGCQLRRKRPHPPPRSRRVRLPLGPPPAHRRAPGADVQAFPSGVTVAPEAPKGPGWGCCRQPPPAGVTCVAAHPSVGVWTGAPLWVPRPHGKLHFQEKPEGDNGRGEEWAGEKVMKCQALDGCSQLRIFRGM